MESEKSLVLRAKAMGYEVRDIHVKMIGVKGVKARVGTWVRLKPKLKKGHRQRKKLNHTL